LFLAATPLFRKNCGPSSTRNSVQKTNKYYIFKYLLHSQQYPYFWNKNCKEQAKRILSPATIIHLATPPKGGNHEKVFLDRRRPVAFLPVDRFGGFSSYRQYAGCR
jgi:hypothetical protein